MRKIVFVHGSICGGIMAALMLLTLPFLDKIGAEKGFIVGYTGMAIAFLMVYFGVRAYRDRVGAGAVTFGRAFRVGGLIALIGCCCYVATWEVVYYTMMPDFADKYAAQVIAEAREAGKSDAEIAAVATKMEAFKTVYRNPLVNVAYTFLEPLPMGLIFTLVTAGVLSRKKKDPVGA
jgi:hypothetical protein